MIAALAWVLSPLFEVLAFLFPRASEGDLLDNAQLAFALKRSGYVPRFEFAHACGGPRLLLGSEAGTQIVRLRKSKRRRKRTA